MKAYHKGQDLWMSHIVFDYVKNVIQVAEFYKRGFNFKPKFKKLEKKMSFEIVTEIMQELCKTKQLDNSDEGQLISE